MVKYIVFLFVVAGALSAICDYSRELIDEFLDARSAESPVRYARAAAGVAAEAARDKAIHQYLLASVSDELDYPASSIKLDKEIYEKYLRLNRRKISESAKKGNALAIYLLYLDTDDVTLLRRAAHSGNVHALNELGSRILEEVKAKGVTASDARASLTESFGYFSRAALKNDPTGCYNLGVCYLNGYGCKKDIALAVENLSKAADLNHPRALCVMGEFYRDGNGVEKSAELSMAAFFNSAKTGNPYGQHAYAMALMADQSEPTNTVAAVDLLKKAALQRCLPAMVEYAKCLYDGVGVDVSFTNSLQGAELVAAQEKIYNEYTNRCHMAVSWWYHCAVEHKSPESMDRLAKCFREGKGVATNDIAAVTWYRRAAEAGYIPAMYNMAECCELGIGGLKKSHYNANWWKTRAHAESGDRNARVWLGSNKLK